MKTSTKVLAAIVIVTMAGAWAFTLYEAYAARRTVLELVQDSSERLRAVLRARATDGVDFDGHARAVEANTAALRNINPQRIIELVDPADGYIVSVREILRRRAVIESTRPRLSGSIHALMAHINADRGGADWPAQAVKLKEAAERDFREFRIATESYVSLLDSFPAAQSKIAAQAKPGWLVDEEAIKQAREAALDSLAYTDENMKQTTRLEAYRSTQPER
jgi:hypothetical protein